VPSRVRSAVAPLYLLACLILGGSAQGAWQNALLQLAGIVILSWAALRPKNPQAAAQTKLLLLIVIAGIALVALQLVPVPPSTWSHGARARIGEDYAVLGRSPPWLPLSFAPYGSLTALLCLIPPMAVFAAIARLNAYRASWLAGALLAGTVAGIMLGTLQVASGGQSSAWYPYPETNFGSAVGFFANANHMASLLLISLPFLAAIGAAARHRTIQHYSALLSIVAALGLLLVFGIVLNRSLAGYLLAVPVLAGSAIIILPRANATRRIAIAVAALSVIGAVVALASSDIATKGKISQDATTSVQSRHVILATSSKAIADYMPLGSGVGSFARVYQLYESPDAVTTDYVVHAHNDYVELALELGAPGILLMLVFLAWWLRAASNVWRSRTATAFAQAASIASAAVLVHSLVDFPLRTAAISACFAMCAALLVERQQPARSRPADLRPARHLVFE
jgi:O-antigen ligase